VAFSPDGQYLGMNDRNGFRFLKTGAWTPLCEFAHKLDVRSSEVAMRMSFHPVGSIAAIMDVDWTTIRLVDLKTRREIASLRGTEDSQIHCIVFSPDGRFLAVSHLDQKVDLWDLALIRRRLQVLELAQGLPDIFEGETPASDHRPIVRVEVKGTEPAALRLLPARQTLREAGFDVWRLLEPDLADADELNRRGNLWGRLGQWRLAAADFRASLSKRPRSASTANELAWVLSAMPGRGDPDDAVRWARKAVELERNDPDFINTLGVALYRAGRDIEAAAILEQNAARHYRMSGYDWVFLAMCQQRLGQVERARRSFTQALSWQAAAGLSRAQIAEFQAFRLEAEALLDSSLPDLPQSVFEP
jgi:tetratricopeptide (TPR) repeat protein